MVCTPSLQGDYTKRRLNLSRGGGGKIQKKLTLKRRVDRGMTPEKKDKGPPTGSQKGKNRERGGGGGREN